MKVDERSVMGGLQRTAKFIDKYGGKCRISQQTRANMHGQVYLTNDTATLCDISSRSIKSITIPEGVEIVSSIVIGRKQAAELAEILITFSETGVLR